MIMHVFVKLQMQLFASVKALKTTRKIILQIGQQS